MMKMIKRYWILESLLITIAVASLAFAGYRLAGIGGRARAVPDTAVLVERPALTADESELIPEIVIESAENESMYDEDVNNGSEYEGEFYLTDAAAQFMQVEVERVDSAMQNGMSLAEIATQLDVDVAEMTEALVAQEVAMIAQLEQRGEIGAEESAEWREEVQVMTPFFIKTVYLDPEVVAANTMGMNLETLWEQMDSGQSIAAIAEARGVAVQQVIDAVVASEYQFVDAMVAEGIIDPEGATEWKSEIEAEVIELANQTFEIEEE
ncbi:MAG: hypothetical protein ACPG8W_19245 [Candidatus Promineifilaceae bacterium]